MPKKWKASLFFCKRKGYRIQKKTDTGDIYA